MRRSVLGLLVALLLVVPAGQARADDLPADPPPGSAACQPGITATPTDLGGTSVLVVASPAIWGPRCLIKGYSVVVTNTTAGIVLDSVSNWLLSYQKTFTLPRGSTLSAVITQGSGSADAEVTILPVAPSVPTSLVAPSATSTSISLQWAAPADDGGSPVTGYSVSWTGGSLQTADTQVTVTGLAPSTTYAFSVSATNGAGSSMDATVAATTAPTPAPTPKPTPSPGPPPPPPPSPQPAVIAAPMAGNGGNTGGTHDADDDPVTQQQTTRAKWPTGYLRSGRTQLRLPGASLVTNAGQRIVVGVTATSPSIATATVTYDAKRRMYQLSAILKPGKVSGSVTVTAVAPATTAGGQAYEGLQASQLYVVRAR